MKNWIYILMIGLMGSLVSSCQQSLDEEVQIPSDTPRADNISMRLVLEGQPTASRNTWGKEEDDNNNEYHDGLVGDDFENEIDITDPNALQVFVEVPNADGGYTTLKVVEQTVIRLEQDNGRVYNLDGILDLNNTGIQAGTYDCKVKVFANCGDDLEEFTFSPNSLIPMWGVQTTNLNLSNLAQNKIEDIYLLRAMAKVQVKLDDAIVNAFELTSVTVDKYNTEGYVEPTGAEDATDTRNLSLQGVFNVKSSCEEDASPLPFLVEKDENGDDTEVFYVYLPEYQNVGEDVTPAEMKVVIDGIEYNLHFKDYTDDSPFNIVRNHYYQYTITGVNGGVELELNYQVENWTDVKNPTINFQ